MKRYLSTIVLVVAIVFGIAAQRTSKPFEINGNVTELECIGVMDVEYCVDNTKSVVVHGSEKALAALDISLRSGKLTIRFSQPKSGGILGKLKKSDRKLRIQIHAPAVKRITASGCTDIKVFGKNGMPYATEKLSVNLSGCSEIDFKVPARINALLCDISGNSDMDMRKLECVKASIDCSGNSSVDIDHIIAESIIADISGNSELELSGSAQKVSLEASGLSEIDARGLKAVKGTVESTGMSNVKCNVENLKSDKAGMSKIKNY